MTLSFDPEVGAAMAAIASARGDVEVPAVGDALTRRANAAAGLPAVLGSGPGPGVSAAPRSVTAADGAEVPLTWLTADGAAPPDGAPGPAVLYLHGGGMILGSAEIWEPVIGGYVRDSGVPALSVDYRLAPEHPHPTPVLDCFAGLTWLVEHAADLGVDPARVAVMGDSAGGGLAAAVCLLARQRGGPTIARQVLVYPMLDDRTTTPDPRFDGLLTWSHDDNATGWGALLGAAAGGPDVPASAAPARELDLGGLPPAYVDVGDLDIFCDEDVAYAARLAAAGVPVELHVHPGAPHGFDVYAPGSALSRRCREDRLRVLRAL